MKIVIGFDGSNAATDALRLGVVHAKAFDAQLVVIFSLVGGKDIDNEEIRQAERRLTFAEDYCRKEGVACETHLLIRGMTPGEDLVTFAEEKRAGEVIIGVKRRSKVGKLLFGSNAQYVILNAPCPVVTIR
jgi:nucleotide-binding universal stress UspA family protein